MVKLRFMFFKFISIFWFELLVVIVVVRLDKLIKELELFVVELFFWIDSFLVFMCVVNSGIRFYIFVVNRIF